MANQAAAKTSEAEAEAGNEICVLDMGSQSRKRIRRLRRGKGKLLNKVEQAIEELQAHGTLTPSVQTVVVVVKEEASIAGLFDDD